MDLPLWVKLCRYQMDLSYITALRKGDILRLRLDQITEQGIWVKQKQALNSFMNGQKVCMRSLTSQWLLNRQRASIYSAIGKANLIQTQALKCLGQRVQVKWAEQGGDRFTFHDIRAKALADAKNLGMDAQRLAGHSSQ